jgi:hypothetical protein
MNVRRFSLRSRPGNSRALPRRYLRDGDRRAGQCCLRRQSDCHGQGNRCLPAGHHRCQQVYPVTRLTPGLYTVTVEKPGFKQGGTRQPASCCRPDESSEPNSTGPGPNFPNVGPLPGPPGISCNGFRGPRYTDVDATLSKSFGLPSMKFLGERANL